MKNKIMKEEYQKESKKRKITKIITEKVEPKDKLKLENKGQKMQNDILKKIIHNIENKSIIKNKNIIKQYIIERKKLIEQNDKVEQKKQLENIPKQIKKQKDIIIEQKDTNKKKQKYTNIIKQKDIKSINKREFKDKIGKKVEDKIEKKCK